MAPFKNTTSLKFCEDSHYNLSLGEQLCQQRKEGLHCDLWIVISGTSVPVHKGVIVAKCDYFSAMFSQSFCEENSASIDMSHVFPSVKTLETVLDYIYTGTILINDQNVDDILQCASHLLLENLGKHCAQYLLSNLAPQNCVHTWALAERYSMPELARIARTMTKSRFQDYIIYDTESLHIPGHFLLRIFTEAALDTMAADCLVEFLKKWSTVNKDECFGILESLIVYRPEIEQYLSKLWLKLKHELSGVNPCSKGLLECPVNAADRKESKNSLVCQKGAMDALITYKIDECSKIGDCRIRSFAYLPSDYKWIELGEMCTHVPLHNMQTEIVGVAGEFLVYKIKTPHHRLLALSLTNTENEEIAYPERHETTVGLVTYKPFCFNQQIFCIVEDERSSNPQFRKSAIRETDFITARNLFVYDNQRKQWKCCCPVPLEQTSGGQQAALDYHIIDAGEVAYIWAMDMYWHENGPGGGPFWMELKSSRPQLISSRGKDLDFEINILKEPPVTSQEWGYKQVKLLGTGDHILVYGYSHHCNMCTPMLQYDKKKGTWSFQEELVIHYPHASLPIQGEHIKSETTHISHICDVQSLTSGLVFHLQDLCPFINRFWALDIQTIEWQELPPPPCGKIKHFIYCRLSKDLLTRSDPAKWTEYGNLPDGPLLNSHLPDSASCFQQVSPSTSSESSIDEELLLQKGHDYIFGEAKINQDMNEHERSGFDECGDVELECFYDALTDAES